MNDLQDITDAWGKWFAERNNLSLHYTASTDYSKHAPDYKKYQVSTKSVADFVTITSSRVTGTDIRLDEVHETRNVTSLEQTSELSLTYDITNTHKVSITHALKIGVKAGAKFKIPLVGDTNIEISTDYTHTNNNEKTETKKNAIAVKIPVRVPPHKKVMGRGSFTIKTVVSSWEVPVLLQGYVAVRFHEFIYWNNSPEKHALWFIPIEDIFKDCSWHEIIDTTGYKVVSNGVHAIIQGECTSSFGTELRKELREGNYDDTWDDLDPHKNTYYSNYLVSDDNRIATAPTHYSNIRAGD
ncbi:hypothetical protein GNQ12_05815 [Pseudomonas aeruginosa]|uniref:ETX/MTX2 family pore-forming toxin n=1 Tax=Pseudomonas aeruginosa TaxID=287 RepID=UPI0012DA35CA|nr:ETX/MTX2 family pore-forming toxin [Pseudomonas aeruginosa]MUJ04975.1 hypothetical protein [Pseudomonas aeruginosa]